MGRRLKYIGVNNKMKTKFLAIAGLATALIGGGAFFAGNAYATSSLERHPEIHKAMRQLHMALDTMNKAADDFHGHKKDAIRMTNGAINELQKALNSDRH
jgi:hypothetical protein